MNPSAAQVILDSLAKGGLQALEPTLGVGISVEIAPPSELAADAMASSASDHPVWLRATLSGGGTAALLLQMQDAARLVGMASGAEGKSELEDGDAATLSEMANAFFGGACAVLAESVAGAGVEVAEGVWAQDGTELAEFIGQPATGAGVTFRAEPDFDGSAILVYAQSIEERLSEQAAAGADGEPLLSDDEMNDILSGFRPEDEPDHAAGPAGPTGEIPENLAVIMDIELVATARLGKIDMPLADVLNFSPGSIIEVGHMIDEPVELLVNDKLIARGDVVVVDEKFGLRITEIISPQERIESLS